MGPNAFIAGSTDNSIVIRIMDATTGLPELTLAFDQAGLSLSYWRHGAASSVVICQAAGTPGQNITLGAAHTDGGFEEIGNGYYRLDVQDAAFLVGAEAVTFFGAVTGMVVYAPTCTLTDPVGALFSSNAIGATGNDSTHLHLAHLTGYGNDELIDELIWVYDSSASEWHPAYITDWVLSTLLATVISARGGGALPFTPEASVDRVMRSGLTRSLLIDSGGLATSAALAVVDANVDAVLVDTGTTLPATLATLQNDVDAVLVDTGTTLPATLATIAAYLDTEIAAILADTDELQIALTDGGRVDQLIDDIKAKTDQLAFTVANRVDAQMIGIAAQTITGDGGTTPYDVS